MDHLEKRWSHLQRSPQKNLSMGEPKRREVKEKDDVTRKSGWKLWTSTNPFYLAVLRHILHSRDYTVFRFTKVYDIGVVGKIQESPFTSKWNKTKILTQSRVITETLKTCPAGSKMKQEENEDLSKGARHTGHQALGRSQDTPGTVTRVDPAYKRGAANFVRTVGAAMGDVDMIVCPCIDYRNIDRHSASVVVDHLVTRGMDEAYKMRSDWYHHGELNPVVGGEINQSQWNDEIVGLYQAAEYLDEEFASKVEIAEGLDKEEDEFLAKLADAETPLYPSCLNHSKLSAIVSLFRLNTKNGWFDKSFNELLETLPEMLPADNVLHTSLYEVKKFLKSFDMSYEKIHACVNDCCLFRKKYKMLENCPKCKASRWKTNMHNGELKKGVPQKVLRYFPIIPRLKRMYRSEEMAKDLRWHFSNKSNDGKLRHHVDSVTWDQMNDKYPSFAAEERNLRLGLSTDGFNPFNMKNTKYSCWPVLLVNYNLPPDLCIKKENIMLTLLIPGPQQPGNSIDIYLEPLIEDLCHLWDNGELTYDAYSKSTFTLKAMLLWTISDFPAYGNLAGCKVKSKMGCPLCGKNTESMWLKFSRKHVYMRHRKGLPATHSYRRKKSWFDGKAEPRRKGRILSGREISVNLRNFKNNFGNLKKSATKRKRMECTGLDADSEDLSSESEEEVEVDEDELSRWKKRSIFFKLQYWEELPMRHNLDVMHVERNVVASIVSTLLNCGKSKDGLNARKDLEELGIRKELHPKTKGKRTYLLAAMWSLSKTEKKIFCWRLFDFKGPDGYCSNISRGVSLQDCKITGLKSHDYHRVIDREHILTLEAEVVETLCMFERFFPPSFFDIMVHLTVHLGREARLGGPVHFRWMYPFERYMKVLKHFVRNTARPEGCIAECYLAEECIQFCNEFLKKTTNVQEKVDGNTEYDNSSILEGRPISTGKTFSLTEMEKKIAHMAVIQNMALVDPFVDEHLQHLQDSNGRCRRDASTLWSMHNQNFASWLKAQIPLNSNRHDETLKWLAFGPRSYARSYTGYIVNGQRFHTSSVDRKSQNSGVFYEATAICRSSAKDTSQVVDLVSYYGRVTDIILLDYNVFYFPLFRCAWAVKGNGVKEEDGFTLVNLNHSQVSFSRDPYILASQAKQVFYSRENESSSWYVAMRGPSRRFSQKVPDKELNEEEPDKALNDEEPKGEIQFSEDPELVGRKRKRQRGQTRMKDIAKDPNTRVQVEYTNMGEHYGKGSVKMSSYVGALVREHVPITFDRWTKITKEIKTILWKSVQARFEVDEEYQKTALLKQMGCLWRSWKSRLVTRIREAKTNRQRMNLRPKNVSPFEWRKFVKLKTSKEFKVVSDSYKERRRNQIPHTTSLKGMVRLTEDMKKESPNPGEVSRLKVWVKSRTRKDCTPVNTNAAEKIRKAADLVNSDAPSSATFETQDSLSQLLGPDNPGRLSVMGRNMTKTKLACFQVKNKCMAEMQEKQANLQLKVNELQDEIEKMKNQRQDLEVGENSAAARSVNKRSQPKCILTDWTGGDATVAEGRIITSDPDDLVNDCRLGPTDLKVLVEIATVPEAYLWRPAINMFTIEKAVGQMIAWPTSKCGQRSNSENKCKLLDLTSDDVVVAEGRWQTQEQNALVNGLPLRPNAVKVFVDVVHQHNTFIWRPTIDITYIEDCLKSFVSWPANKVVFENTTDATGQQSPLQKSVAAQNSVPSA
ncbi:Transposase Tnp1/En/Spm-like [Arabidopsis suecica]|uniref:Transposase Tnp1/En/Spm-like n=1 Tax=Arabidopsis suecica TaxID=45249 RepID=A0A8T2AFN5_ARASU|nr:Transposase Tnp1/En/Spm-like [Arabidopsis suecica]